MTREVTGSPGRAGSKLPWVPHVTIAYSTARQPVDPIITALGPSLPERKIQINAISVVDQRGPGPERSWGWHPKAAIRFRMSPLDHDHPVSPEPVAAARAGLVSVGDAGRLAGLLGMLADPVRSRILFALSRPGSTTTTGTGATPRWP